MITFIFAAVGLICAGFFIRKLVNDVAWGWGSLLLVQLYSAALGISQASIGPLHLDVNDVVVISLLIAGAIRTFRRLRDGSTSQTFLVIYLGFFAFSLLRGIVTDGVFAAGNEARGLVAPVVGMLYFFTIPTDSDTVSKLLRLYLYYAAALITVTLLGYAGAPLGSNGVVDHDYQSASNGRIIGAIYAVAIALAFIITVGWNTYRERSRFTRWLTPLSLAMVMILRHRTLWVMLGIVIIILPSVDLKILRRLLPMAILGGIVAVGLGIAVYGSGTGGASDTFEDSATESGTWEWRVESWRQLVYDEDQTVITALWGRSFGSGFYRFETITGQYKNLPPHSEYVTQYLRVGVLGAIALFSFLLRPFFVFISLQRGDPEQIFPSASTWAMLICAIVVFGVTYSVPVDLWGLVGIANILVSKQQLASSHDYELLQTPAPEDFSSASTVHARRSSA